ncbi:hypothetical protein, partial [Phocaeicola faecalis]|uniref:hypothetical protein n=1 Tax=Phocaeicola faecalis TaxID=2786956 RepID=UPI001F310019
RGEVCSPENSLFCVFGQANPAPTTDDGIARFSFDTLPCCKKDLDAFQKDLDVLKKTQSLF